MILQAIELAVELILRGDSDTVPLLEVEGVEEATPELAAEEDRRKRWAVDL